MSRKQVECLICHKSMRADNLPRHKNTCSVPYKPETVMGKDIKQQYVGSDKILNQQHSKTLTPKISDLVDAIINEKYEPSEKFQRKDLVEKSTDDKGQYYSDTLDLISKVVTSENENENNGGNVDYNDQFWNEKTQIIKRLNNSKKEKNIMNKLLQELKRGERQNKRKLITLLDILKDCGTIDNGCYEKVYNLICSM